MAELNTPNLAYVPSRTSTATSSGGVIITPGTPLPDGVCRSIFVGNGGDVAVVPVANKDQGTAIIYRNCPSGVPLHVGTNLVIVAGTTATDLVAMY